MANISCSFCGIPMDNPFVLGSGPLGFSAESLAECSACGAGAVTTKTIREEGYVNPTPHMRLNGKNGLINSEGWSDYPASYWFEGGLQKAKELGAKVLIASIGSVEKPKMIDYCRKAQNAGADIIEINDGGYYESDHLPDVTGFVKDAVSIPVITKVNRNWVNAAGIAARCVEMGADGIVTMDSMGPTMRFDLASGHPLVNGYGGIGWTTGASLLPFALQIVNDLAKHAETDIVGLGGIISGEDALEMLIAGASVCGVCSAPIIYGPKYFQKLARDLSAAMDKYGYATIADASRASLRPYEEETCSPDTFCYDADKCTSCMRCVNACSYSARKLNEKVMSVDADACRGCGLCFDVCPTKAISRK